MREGTALASVMSFLIFVGACIRVDPAVEQPTSSLLNYLPFVARLFEVLELQRTSTYLGAFGAETAKPLKLFHCLSWLHALKRARPSGMPQLAIKHKSGHTGRKKEMRDSQAYPAGFGWAIAEGFVSSRI